MKDTPEYVGKTRDPRNPPTDEERRVEEAAQPPARGGKPSPEDETSAKEGT